MILQIVALALPIAAAYGVLERLSCFPRGRPGRFWMILSLSAGIGPGFASCFFFAWLALFGAANRWFFIAEFIVYGLCMAMAIARTRRSPTAIQDVQLTDRPRLKADRTVRGALTLFALLAAAGFWLVWRAHPHGDWDAWAIWNLRARFLFRGGEQWTDTFLPPLSWTHPDYPLLLPASVARLWFWGGSETTVAAAMIAFVYSAATVGLLASSVTRFGGLAQGCFAALALIGNEFFLTHAAARYADVPLAFFILAAIVMLGTAVASIEHAASALAVAGVACGLAAWTKNEGLLVLICVLGGWGLVAARTRGVRAWGRGLAPLTVGLFVPLIIVAWFKWRYAPTNDLVAAATSSDIRQRLLDGSRYLKVAGTFLYGLVGYGDGLVAALPLVALVLGRRAQGAHRSVVALATTIVMLMACGYVLIYILSPHDLDWHLRTSLKRLILHLYPSMLFAFFVFVDSPSAATPTAARGAATSG